MAFLRVVEVLPPLHPASRKKDDRIPAEAGMERFVREVRGIRGVADVVLVGNVKDTSRLKVDPLYAAIMLQERLRVEAAPVIVVRDQNRQQFLSSVLTAAAAGLKSIMVAWGDDYPASAGVTNVRDFPNLAGAIREASLILSRAGAPTNILAPVDVESLANAEGASLVKNRLRAGAGMLLAQPPTTDAGTFERHASLLGAAGLKGKVLLNVFPFRDARDIARYEKMFGWGLSEEVHAAARDDEGGLIALETAIIRRLRAEGHPGVYLVTRGNPGLAKVLLS